MFGATRHLTQAVNALISTNEITNNRIKLVWQMLMLNHSQLRQLQERVRRLERAR